MNCNDLFENVDFKKRLDGVIKNLIPNLDNPNEVNPTIKTDFVDAIKQLRKDYSDFGDEEFRNALNEYLDDTSGLCAFDDYINKGFTYLEDLLNVNISFDNVSEEEVRESKMDSFASTLEKMARNVNKGQFLDKYFPLAPTSKLYFLRDFKNNVVKALFLDANGNLIRTDLDRNKSIDHYRESLIEDIVSNLDEDSKEKFNARVSLTAKLNFAKKYFDLNNIGTLIQKLPIMDTLDSQRKAQLKVWKAWVALSNFDNLIKYNLGTAITINNFGDYADYTDKYKLRLGDRNTTNWRNDDDDTDETEELGSLPILYLESLHTYDTNGNANSDYLHFSNVKVTIGQIMNLFNDLDNQIVSDAALNSIKTEFAPLYGSEVLDRKISQYIQGKTLKQILANAKQHLELQPLFFRLLLPVLYYDSAIHTNININNFSAKFNSLKVKETISSLYYNLFAPENSLFSATVNKNGFDPNENNILQQIMTLFVNIENKPALEYSVDYEEGTKLESLADKSRDTRFQFYSRNLDGKYRKNNYSVGELVEPGVMKFNTFNLVDNLDGTKSNYPKGITLETDDYNINVVPSNSGTTATVRNKNGNTVTLDNSSRELWPVLKEILEVDDNVLTIYLTSMSKNFSSLVGAASNIMYNYAVGKRMLNIEKDYDNEVKKYYTSKAPKKMWHSIQPQLIGTTYYTAMRDLSKAKDLAEGYSELNTVQDAAAKSISTLGLSNLASKVGEIWETHTKDIKSPCNGFTLFDLYLGFELVRDFKGFGIVKQGKDFNVNELAKASILFDYYGDMATKDADNNDHSGVCRIMGPVVSDKSNLIKLKFGWDTAFPRKYWDGENILTLRNVTNDKLKQIMKSEFGSYYQKIYDNIIKQISILNKYVIDAAANVAARRGVQFDATPIFDYNSNFESVNTAYGKYASEVLHEAVALALQNNENVEIIDLVMYIEQRDGTIKNNPSILHLLKLWTDNTTEFKTDLNINETFDQFISRKEAQLISDFLQFGVNLQIRDNGTTRKGMEQAFSKNTEFLRGGKIAIAKIHDGESEIKLASMNDLLNWPPYREFIQAHPEAIKADNPQFNLSKTLELINPGQYQLEINPELVKHNLLDFFLGEEYILATTGTYVAHPAKGSTIQEREANLFAQAVKRYVSYTASKHREASGTLNGIKSKLKVAVVQDVFNSAFNVSGELDNRGIKVFDGASFYNATMNYLSNNSLGGDAMGVDKKPFAHYQGTESGIGFILKTAGFPHTNDRIRNSVMDARMHKKMNDIKWDRDIDWTKSFNNEDLNYGEWFVNEDYTAEDGIVTRRWFKYSNPVKRDDKFYVTKELVLNNGEVLNVPSNGEIEVNVNSNWDLWKLFGGAYSGHIGSTGTLTYEGDNSSVERLVYAINNVGKKRNDKVFSQDDLEYSLKDYQIDIVATAGAVKYGGANINSQDAFFDDNYNLTYMYIDTYDIGEQLDAEHTAEDGQVALMTLVINALSARGYSVESTKDCYNALNIIATTMFSNTLRALNEANLSEDLNDFKESLFGIIRKILAKATSEDGNLLNAVASSIGGSEKLNWQSIQQIPINHPALFAKFNSSIAAELEKAIRLKFPGGMLVLNPSDGRFKIINGKLSGYYNTRKAELLALEGSSRSISNPAQIRVGFNYKNVKTGEIIQVNNPAGFYKIERLIYEGNQFRQTFIDAKGNPLGRDLAPYNVTFKDVEGNEYNLWQLTAVRNLFANPNIENGRELLQKALNALSKEGKEDTVYVTVYNPLHGVRRVGKNKTENFTIPTEDQNPYQAIAVRVNKDSIVVDPYEAVLPMIYKTKFALREGDEILKILDDKLFFLRRIIDNWTRTKVDPQFYDLELKTINGNHFYLAKDADEELQEVPIDVDILGDTVYRLNSNGDRMYSIPAHFDDSGNLILDAKVYKDYNGNEIICTDNITYMLDELDYHTIVVSPETPYADVLLGDLARSLHRAAKGKLRGIVANISAKAKRMPGISVLNAILESALKDTELLDLFDIGDLSLDDILTDEEFRNEAIRLLENDSDYVDKQLLDIQEFLKDGTATKSLKYLQDVATKMHTSFEASLENVVSRTPAQSHQSFMAMRVAAFGKELTNSAYVSRLQLYLLGSDYTLK